jgi:putative transposase
MHAQAPRFGQPPDTLRRLSGALRSSRVTSPFAQPLDRPDSRPSGDRFTDPNRIDDSAGDLLRNRGRTVASDLEPDVFQSVLPFLLEPLQHDAAPRQGSEGDRLRKLRSPQLGANHQPGDPGIADQDGASATAPQQARTRARSPTFDGLVGVGSLGVGAEAELATLDQQPSRRQGIGEGGSRATPHPEPGPQGRRQYPPTTPALRHREILTGKRSVPGPRDERLALLLKESGVILLGRTRRCQHSRSLPPTVRAPPGYVRPLPGYVRQGCARVRATRIAGPMQRKIWGPNCVSSGMARPLRHLTARTLVEVTVRTMHGRLLLRPSATLNDLVLGVLGHAQQRFGLEIVALTVLSNHLHLLVVTDRVDQLADFMEYSLSKIAREIGKLHDWKEKFWGRRYRAIPVSDEPDAQIERLRYLLENGVKENLVAHPREWPGIQCVGALLDGEALEGTWFDRTVEYLARRAKRELEPEESRSREMVTLSPLPCWAHLGEAERRRRVAEMVEDIAQTARLERRGRGVLGRERVLKQAPHQRPSRCDRSPAPLVHAASKAMRLAMKAAYRAFLEAYRTASASLRAGEWRVEFPPGCFPPALPPVPLAAPG